MNLLSLVLNGDRDAYQAFVAQLLALNAKTEGEINQYNADSQENIDQTKERVGNAALILGGAGIALQNNFDNYYE